MKKIFLLVVLVLAMVVLHSNAGAWLLGKAPPLEYNSEELKRCAEVICLADLTCTVKVNSFAMVDPDERAYFGKLWWAMKRKNATMVVENTDYDLEDFRESRNNTGIIMGWPFKARCVSKVITPNGEFSKQSEVKCFIWVDEYGDQFFDLPDQLAPLADWSWKK